MNISELLRVEEGYREAPYYCSEGYPTIGIGQRIGPKGADLSNYEFTVSIAGAEQLVFDSLSGLYGKLTGLNWFVNLPDDRQDIILSMAYQLGFNGLLKFKNMIKALIDHDWGRAKVEALDSRWAKQTPRRANRHALVLGGFSIDEVYKDLI